MPGPHESRLIKGLHGTRPGQASSGADEWRECATILREVARGLATATLPVPAGDAGAETAAAMQAAFRRSATAMAERASRLDDGHNALKAAAEVIEDARSAHAALGPEGTAPTYSPHEDPGSKAGIKAHNAYLADAAAFQAQQQHRESVSQAQVEKMNTVFGTSSQTMKQIHGQPDPPPAPAGYSGGGASGSGGAAPAHQPTRSSGPGTVLRPTGGTDTPHSTHQGDPSGGGPGYAPGTGAGPSVTPAPAGAGPVGGTAQGGSTIDYAPASGSGAGSGAGPTGATPVASAAANGLTGTAGLGLAGAAAGGIGGGLLGTGLASGGLRGGLGQVVSGPGTAAGGVRGIGATSRAGVPGTLGRPGASVVGAGGSTSTRSAGARSSGVASGRGTGGRRTGGAGSIASGRSGRTKDDRKGRRSDVFDTVAEEWVDDEDAAPGVLD